MDKCLKRIHRKCRLRVHRVYH